MHAGGDTVAPSPPTPHSPLHPNAVRCSVRARRAETGAGVCRSAGGGNPFGQTFGRLPVSPGEFAQGSTVMVLGVRGGNSWMNDGTGIVQVSLCLQRSHANVRSRCRGPAGVAMGTLPRADMSGLRSGGRLRDACSRMQGRCDPQRQRYVVSVTPPPGANPTFGTRCAAFRYTFRRQLTALTWVWASFNGAFLGFVQLGRGLPSAWLRFIVRGWWRFLLPLIALP